MRSETSSTVFSRRNGDGPHERGGDGPHERRVGTDPRSVLWMALMGSFMMAIATVPAAWGQQLPDAPGKAAVQKVCSGCHGMNMVTGRGRTRDQWAQVVASMVARGAKGSEAELSQVVEYLSQNFPPGAVPAAAAAGKPTKAPAPKPGGIGAGPDDAQVVDDDAAALGKTIYIAECVTCHGPKARGANANVPDSQKGPDLVRSLIILHDRYGSTLGPFLKAGHPTQSGVSSASFTEDQLLDLSHFLHQQVENTLRSGPYSQIQNVLTGDPKAGQAFFNGDGKCSTCHSPTGDLAGVGKKYDPPTLQSKFLFPRSFGFGRRAANTSPTKPTTVTVTPPAGPAITGTLEHLDDFNVSLRDANGEYHAWKRTADLRVEKHDPYAVHVELLDLYTDKNMHDIVAYLETLQ
jgi:cytochrome c oxidase cbb3-type subunit III